MIATPTAPHTHTTRTPPTGASSAALPPCALGSPHPVVPCCCPAPLPWATQEARRNVAGVNPPSTPLTHTHPRTPRPHSSSSSSNHGQRCRRIEDVVVAAAQEEAVVPTHHTVFLLFLHLVGRHNAAAVATATATGAAAARRHQETTPQLASLHHFLLLLLLLCVQCFFPHSPSGPMPRGVPGLPAFLFLLLLSSPFRRGARGVAAPGGPLDGIRCRRRGGGGDGGGGRGREGGRAGRLTRPSVAARLLLRPRPVPLRRHVHRPRLPNPGASSSISSSSSPTHPPLSFPSTQPFQSF